MDLLLVFVELWHCDEVLGILCSEVLGISVLHGDVLCCVVYWEVCCVMLWIVL